MSPAGDGRGALTVTLAAEFAELLVDAYEIRANGQELRLAAPGKGGHERPLTPAEVAIVGEYRRCFYAGAAAMYGLLTFGLTHENITQDEAEAALARLREELLAQVPTVGGK